MFSLSCNKLHLFQERASFSFSIISLIHTCVSFINVESRPKCNIFIEVRQVYHAKLKIKAMLPTVNWAFENCRLQAYRKVAEQCCVTRFSTS
jgi:hypothetical protein